jgi:hypothetical protein
MRTRCQLGMLHGPATPHGQKILLKCAMQAPVTTYQNAMDPCSPSAKPRRLKLSLTRQHSSRHGTSALQHHSLAQELCTGSKRGQQSCTNHPSCAMRDNRGACPAAPAAGDCPETSASQLACQRQALTDQCEQATGMVKADTQEWCSTRTCADSAAVQDSHTKRKAACIAHSEARGTRRALCTDAISCMYGSSSAKPGQPPSAHPVKGAGMTGGW